MGAVALRAIRKLAFAGALALIASAVLVVTVIPRAVNGAALTVLTGSMTPTIPVGSVVVVRPVDPGTLQVGDVVTYQREPGKVGYITHRILEIHEETVPVTLTTKGDANRGEDTTPVPVTAVRGQVWFHAPYLGTVQNALSTGGGAVPLAVLGLAAYALMQIASFTRDRRRTASEVTAPAAIEATERG